MKESHQKYTSLREENLVMLNAIIIFIVIILNLAISYILTQKPNFTSLSILVFLSGNIGGATSNYRRLQTLLALKSIGESNKDNELKKTETLETPIPYPESVDNNLNFKGQTSKERLDTSEILLLKIQTFLSPLLGGLFAFLLYGIFISGVVQGELFPQFKGIEEEYRNPSDYIVTVDPKTNKDVAKLMLWSFIAGFAEELVPSYLNRLIKNAEQKKI